MPPSPARVVGRNPVTSFEAVDLVRPISRAVALAAVVAAAVAAAGRARSLRGATPDEAEASLPGDDLVPDPVYAATFATTIAAPAGAVWPWLVQMGQDRGGFYTFTFLERLGGVGVMNADRVVPEWQALEPGAQVLLAPGRPMTVALAAPPRTLVLHQALDADGAVVAPDDPAAVTRWTWGFHLRGDAPGHARLVVRMRWGGGGGARAAAQGLLLWGPSALLLTRGQLRGIRRRVEAAHAAGGVA